MDRNIDNKNKHQGAGSSNTLRTNEQKTYDNDEDLNLQRFARDIKPPSTYEPSFDGKSYEYQQFSVERGCNMMTIRSLNIVSVDAIFKQALQI